MHGRKLSAVITRGGGTCSDYKNLFRVTSNKLCGGCVNWNRVGTQPLMARRQKPSKQAAQRAGEPTKKHSKG